MIRTEQEEFFIEPLERGSQVTGEEEGGAGRQHVVYRSSAVKKPPADLMEDFHSRGQSASCAFHPLSNIRRREPGCRPRANLLPPSHYITSQLFR